MLGREPRRSNLQPDFRRFSLIRPNRSRPFSRIELVQVKREMRYAPTARITNYRIQQAASGAVFRGDSIPVLTFHLIYQLRAAE
jgi:hypothetical protein